jgi:Domain of unknown function (DUF4136)
MKASGPFLLFLFVALPASAEEIKLDYDREVDFSRYKTFAWSPGQDPAKNPANHIRITRSVERGFTAKGLAKSAEGNPDAYLMYHARVDDLVKVTGKSAGGYWEPSNLRTTVDIGKVRQGTLVLEMYDGGTKDVIWRGIASGLAVRPDRTEEDIDAAVKKLLEGYPPAKEAEAKPKP